MWAVAFENEKNFDKLIASFNGITDYEVQTTGTGARVAIASEAKRGAPNGYPHFFLVDPNPDLAKHAISWVHKNLHPSVLISADISDDWRSESQETYALIPHSCLRSSGRIDVGGGPILYEEILFDPWVQSALRKQFEPQPTLGEKSHKLFGSHRPIPKNSESHWISENLKCQSYDTFSAELLLAGKRLGLKIGCAKILSSHPKALGQLIEFWSSFRIPT